jgi:hypothetical protein
MDAEVSDMKMVVVVTKKGEQTTEGDLEAGTSN